MSNVKSFFRNPSAKAGIIIIALIILAAVVGPYVTQSPFEQNLAVKLQKPSWEHLLGTDDFGRDLLARIVYGARFSLTAGLVSVTIGLVGGLFLGMLAGYYGGIIDRVVSIFCEILLAFPSILLALSVTMILGAGIYTPMIAVGISSIPTFARLVRAQFMHLRESCYIEAIRVSGASDARIILRHLLPNSMGPIVVQATLRIGSAILTAATLSFLGMGAQPPTPEWGTILNDARSYIWTGAHMAIVPGCAITITVVGVNLLGDALRDFMDPRSRAK